MNTFNLKLASRASLALSSLLLVLAAAPGFASAHAEVQSSNPANGSTVSQPISQIAIVFTEDISPDQSSAQLVGPSGAMSQGVTAAVDRANRTNLNITTSSPLEPGAYKVNWAAVTEDDNGHTNGTIAFTVAGTSAGGSTASGSSGSTNSGTTTTGGDSMPATGSADAPFLTAALLGCALVLSVLGLTLRRKANAVAKR